MHDFEATINDLGVLEICAKTPLAAFALMTWAENNKLPEKMSVSWSTSNFWIPYVRDLQRLEKEKV